jgi:hypothetical protein
MVARQDFLEPFGRALRIAVVLACHLGLAIIIVGCIKVFELVFHLFWVTSEPLLFDLFPLRYVFHAMDLSVIGVFIWKGVEDAVRAF